MTIYCIEFTNWELFQLEKYGDILELPEVEIEEPNEDQERRMAEYMNLNYERQLHEYEQ